MKIHEELDKDVEAGPGSDYAGLSEEGNANIFSKTTFGWATSLFFKARKQRKKNKEELTQFDLWAIRDVDTMKTLLNDFFKEKEGVSKQIWSVIRYRFTLTVVFKFLNSTVQFGTPLLMYQLLEALSTSEDRWVPFVYIVAMFVVFTAQITFESLYYWSAARSGWKARSVLTHRVQAKTLCLSQCTRNVSTSSGKLISLMQVDPVKIERFINQAAILWDSLYQILGYEVILITKIGWGPSLLGLVVVLFFIPIQVWLSKYLVKLNAKLAKVTDKRVQLSKDTLQTIHGVKLGGWEDISVEVIQKQRKQELEYLRQSILFKSLVGGLLFGLPAFAAVVSLTMYAVLHNGTMTTATVFTVATIWSMTIPPMSSYPTVIAQYAEAKISLGRLEEFFNLEETSPPTCETISPAEQSEDAITIQDGTFHWSSNADSTPVLKNINLRFPRATLTAVMGRVGSGKSSLLYSTMGELRQSTGLVSISGKVAFAPQVAFVMNATIRENIIFGHMFNQERYEKVVRVTQLEADIATFPDGDNTAIGERGVTLSGGQRQRLNLARAAYANNDIVILDDQLSALDPNVARRVFGECIKGFIVQEEGRTVVMSTNEIGVAEECDKVVCLKDGEVIHDGVCAGKSLAPMTTSVQPAEINSAPENKSKTGGTLIETEERAHGAVSVKDLGAYVQSGGGALAWVVMGLVFLVAQGARFVNSYWLKLWSADAMYIAHSRNFYLVGYALTSVMVAWCDFVASYMFYILCLKASRALHEAVLQRILHAPMSFFHSTPLGRIVARLSSDIYMLDRDLPANSLRFIRQALTVAMFVITIAVFAPISLSVVPVVLVAYIVLVALYRPVARDAKRLESISRSPIYSNYIENAVNGSLVLRAFKRESWSLEKLDTSVEENIRNSYALIVAQRWVNYRITFIGNLFAIVSMSLVAYLTLEGSINESSAGLALSYIMQIALYLGVLLRNFVNVETDFNSVERINYYATMIPQEDTRDDPSDMPAEWPSKGALNIQNLSVRYHPEQPLILKNVSFSIAAGERVGVIGRTGSGKSTFINTLVRIVEPEASDTPSILLDGQDVAKLSLKTLRSGISIVPQDPIVYSGTLATNLDPFNLVGGEDKVLRTLQDDFPILADILVRQFPTGMSFEIVDQGANLSQGEKQIIAFARAVIVNPKVLLLDEATSSVDYKTDGQIQECIREYFKSCTIITIAHRLATVSDSDKIVNFDNGSVQVGPPSQFMHVHQTENV